MENRAIHCCTPYAHIPCYWEQEGVFILVPMQVSLRLNTYIACTTKSSFQIHMYIGSSILLNTSHKIAGSGNTLHSVMSRYYGGQNSHTGVL